MQVVVPLVGEGTTGARIVSAVGLILLAGGFTGIATNATSESQQAPVTQSLAFTRIGEALVASLGASYDESKDNVGVSFLIEPRFLPDLSVTRKTGIEVPPAGVFGLE